MFCFLLFCYSIISTFWDKFDHSVSVNGEITHVIFHQWRNNTCAPPYPFLYVRRNNTCEHSCPGKIAHASLHIRSDITHAIFHVFNSCSKVLFVNVSFSKLFKSLVSNQFSRKNDFFPTSWRTIVRR